MSCPVEMLYSVQYQDTVCQEIVFLAGRILLLKRIKCFLTPSERVDAKKQCFWHLSAWRDARNVVSKLPPFVENLEMSFIGKFRSELGDIPRFSRQTVFREAINVVYRAKRRGFRQYTAFLASRRPD